MEGSGNSKEIQVYSTPRQIRSCVDIANITLLVGCPETSRKQHTRGGYYCLYKEAMGIFDERTETEMTIDIKRKTTVGRLFPSSFKFYIIINVRKGGSGLVVARDWMGVGGIEYRFE